jgi:hypothetical protein
VLRHGALSRSWRSSRGPTLSRRPFPRRPVFPHGPRKPGSPGRVARALADPLVRAGTWDWWDWAGIGGSGCAFGVGVQVSWREVLARATGALCRPLAHPGRLSCLRPGDAGVWYATGSAGAACAAASHMLSSQARRVRLTGSFRVACPHYTVPRGAVLRVACCVVCATPGRRPACRARRARAKRRVVLHHGLAPGASRTPAPSGHGRSCEARSARPSRWACPRA